MQFSHASVMNFAFHRTLPRVFFPISRPLVSTKHHHKEYDGGDLALYSLGLASLFLMRYEPSPQGIKFLHRADPNIPSCSILVYLLSRNFLSNATCNIHYENGHGLFSVKN